MKRITTIGAVLLVIGYFGFEVSNLYRLQYRMEPLYIFDQYASAQAATELCGSPDEEERRRFTHNFDYVRSRAVVNLMEPPSVEDMIQAEKSGTAVAAAVPLTEAQAEAAIQGRLQLRRGEVDALLESQGCGGPDLRRLVKFHEIRARLNLGNGPRQSS